MKALLKYRLQAKRRGIVDIWNSFMLLGAEYDEGDIPFCPTTAKSIPTQLVSWPEAKRMYKASLRRGDRDYKVHAFIHFYVDDNKFDGLRSSIWLFPWRAYEVIKHFDGIVTPDFSMCQDFPEPLKTFAVYRMRTFGYWIGSMGLSVINNVRWGTKETWRYCFRGVKRRTVVAVGTVASGLKKLENRPLFEEGLEEMVKVLKPSAIIIYGSANYSCLQRLSSQGIEIIQFDSDTSKAFAKEVNNEQDQ